MTLNLSKFRHQFKFRLFSTSKLYTKNHEWIEILQNEVGERGGKHSLRTVMGITDYSQKALGDIVFVEMPKIDTMYKSEGKIIKFDFLLIILFFRSFSSRRKC